MEGVGDWVCRRTKSQDSTGRKDPPKASPELESGCMNMREFSSELPILEQLIHRQPGPDLQTVRLCTLHRPRGS